MKNHININSKRINMPKTSVELSQKAAGYMLAAANAAKREMNENNKKTVTKTVVTNKVTKTTASKKK